MKIVLVILLAAGLCHAVLAWLLRSGRAAIALDRPNERSLHAQPIPRVGGLGLMAGVVPSLVLAGLPPEVVGAAVLLAVVSFADDRRGLPIGVRFGAHFLAAALLMWAAFRGTGLVWWLPLLAVAAVWMTNLYNFMDGSDGLAGGMAVAGFGSYAVAAGIAGDAILATGAGAIVAAAFAFLRFNFHPARVFMGDAGSIPLGFLAAAFGVLGWVRGLWPAWFPLVVFGPFVADATATLLRRMIRGERFWEPHRTHYYQRLVQLGWGHRRTAIAAYALMAAGSVVALAMREAPPALAGTVLAALGAAYGLLARRIDRAWHARSAEAGV